MSENRCICCVDVIPEGRQVCPICEAMADETCAAILAKYGIGGDDA